MRKEKQNRFRPKLSLSNWKFRLLSFLEMLSTNKGSRIPFLDKGNIGKNFLYKVRVRTKKFESY